MSATAVAGFSALVGCAGPRGTTATETATSTARETVTAYPGPEHYAGRVPQTFGTSMRGIVEMVPVTPGRRTIALTFDACGGPSGSAVDQGLIDALREFAVPATLFLSATWIEANPDATRKLAADPLFRLENHGTRHLPLSVNGEAAYGIAGTATPAEAIAEIDGNRALLADYGVESTWFRSGTAHYDDVAVDIARDRGVAIAGYSVNGDFGATAAADHVASAIMQAPDGAIVLAHMNHPTSGTGPGVRQALEQLPNDEVRFTFLDGSRP
ncbi:polysaccharide deacetylase family protein [Corynebacterium afermentans]|nr:polysaccharide deacetylase family protein [Corynebacterium afermentans]